MVIAAAWLFLHPKRVRPDVPEGRCASPATLQLAQPASIYELTICLGNGGTRDGYMRALRNLNPRYEADSWLPAGATLNATTKIVGLYNRHCTQGPRADLAHQLVHERRRFGDRAVPRRSPPPMIPHRVRRRSRRADTPQACARPRKYKVRGGETLTSISQEVPCDMRRTRGSQSHQGAALRDPAGADAEAGRLHGSRTRRERSGISVLGCAANQCGCRSTL